jgi:hypothetical protein
MLILILLLFFGGCKWYESGTMKWYEEKVPEQLLYIEKKLVKNLQTGSNWSNGGGYYIITMIAKKNDAGIYSYAERSVHRFWFHTFMFDGDSVYYTNINDSVGMFNFLDSNHFSKREIKKFHRNLNRLKNGNTKTREALIF